MAEKEKKAKAPAKPRAASTTPRKTTTRSKTTETTAEKVSAVTPTHAEIARLAEQYWAERGHVDGHAEQDWLRAERELMKIAS